MDPGTMHEVWLNLATNSPFLAFVIYNWYQQSKTSESYRLEMKTDRENYEKKREESEEKLRLRYMKVIESLQSEKADAVENRLTSLEKSIRKVFAVLEELRKMKGTVEELRIKDQVRDLK